MQTLPGFWAKVGRMLRWPAAGVAGWRLHCGGTSAPCGVWVASAGTLGRSAVGGAVLGLGLFEAGGEAGFDGGPLGRENAVEDAVALEAVVKTEVTAQGAFAGGAEAFDGALGSEVAGVGFEWDAAVGEVGVLEAVGQEEELDGGVDGSAASFGGQPGKTDFEGAFGGAKVEETGGADNALVGEAADGEEDAGAGEFVIEHGGDPASGVDFVAKDGGWHVAPGGLVASNGEEVGSVGGSEEGLEAHVGVFEGDGTDAKGGLGAKGNHGSGRAGWFSVAADGHGWLRVPGANRDRSNGFIDRIKRDVKRIVVNTRSGRCAACAFRFGGVGFARR